MTNVLVVDSERSIRNTLKERLEYEGYRVETAETGGEAADKTEHSRFDVVLCDMAVPDIRAIDLLTSLHGSGKSTPFIMLSALKGLDPAIDSIRHGAFDYIPKPIDLNKLLRSIRSAVEDKSQNRATIETPSGKKSSAARAGDSARVVAKASCAPTEIVGTSVGIEHMKQLIEKVAPSDARVLITGDNGTGKELVAHRLHELSHRADRPFVEVNCAAIPSELIESELFGHEKGSFTSAIRMRKGKFEQADGGTLFLDEIGDMSLAAQAKVLRALQENRISRVGSDKDIEVDVRVVAATSRNLEQMVKDGLFRRDLYYRLNVFPVSMPPLRERQGDIPLLVENFLEKYGHKIGKRGLRVAPEAEALLLAHSWPGNIRELENVIERAVILTTDGLIRPDLLPPAMQAPCALCSLRGTLPDALEQLERQLITEALQEHRGNMGHAAQALGISERVMGLRMRKFGLGYKAFRRGAP